jgi:hypothetical protein
VDIQPEVTEYVGATSFLPVARKSDVCLFIQAFAQNSVSVQVRLLS